MSKGYPSMERARKAYWRGASSVARQRPGGTASSAATTAPQNPYRNDKLAALWRRGRERAQADPDLKIPTRFGQRHIEKQRPRNPDRPPTRRRDPRDFDRGGGRGGW
jgi:hypothetical protein